MTQKEFHIIEKMFRSEATREEVQELLRCLHEDTLRSELSAYYRQKWDESEGSSVSEELRMEMLTNLKQQIESQQPERKTTFRIGRIYKSVAAVMLPVVMLLSAYQLWNSQLDKHASANMASVVTVENGQKASLKLPDGTKVWLNSGSVFSYSNGYNRADRVVKLQGEAYFEVAKDKIRPFIVQTNSLNVRALGTTFNVKAYPNDLRTTATLLEGKVKVYTPEFSTLMEPNQKVVFDEKQHRLVKTGVEDAEMACLWKRNQLAFDSETLGEMAVILERTYNVDIEFESEKIKQIRFCGIIKNNSLQSVLQLIALAAPVTYSLDQTKVTFRAAR